MSEFSRADDTPPGGVSEGDPGLTPRVLEAIATARRIEEYAWLAGEGEHEITDANGPHQHRWQPILWVCRGCGAVEE